MSDAANVTEPGGIVEGEVDHLLTSAHYVVYAGILPVFFVIGIVCCLTCVLVFRRPAFKTLHVKRYFQILAWGDVMLFLTYLPIMVTLSGCYFHSYWFAWYFAHLGWAMTGGFHAFCTYIITWLALDRCLAVWFHQGYLFVQRPQVQRIRIVVTVIFLFFVYIVYIVDAEVVCTSPSGMEVDPDCHNGTWITNDGFQKSYDETWHMHYRRFHTSVTRWIPGILLAIFNLSLVVGVQQGLVRANATTRAGEGRQGAKARQWERNLVATMIAMSTSYLALSMPITVYLTFFAEHVNDRCFVNYPAETLRHVGNTLQLLEHVLHPVFLAALNPTFRKELLFTLRPSKQKNRPQSIYPSEILCTDIKNTSK